MLSEPQTHGVARYGDGHAAERIATEVWLDDAGLHFQFAGAAPTLWPYKDLRVNLPILARSTDAIVMAHQAGGASLHIDDTMLLAQLIKRAPHLTLGAERWRAARPGLAAGLVALIAYGSISLFDLSPSKSIAGLMPQKARVALGEQVIRTMPSKGRCSNAEGQRALEALVRRVMPKGPVGPEAVQVLDWPLLNAFAVPGNRIVLTRQLIEEARGPDELAAVIAHEAGHVAELHPEAGLVRSVGFWALIQMMFTGTPGAIGNIGAVLAQLGYTRSAEHAADDFALKLLREANVSPKGMLEFFRRMAAQEAVGAKPAKSTQQTLRGKDLFSSHPATEDRIKLIESQPNYASTPALSDDDWKALKRICLSAADMTAEAEANRKRVAEMAEVAAAELKKRQEAAEAKRLKEVAEAEAAQQRAKEAAAALAAQSEAKAAADARKRVDQDATPQQPIEPVRVAAAVDAKPPSPSDPRLAAANRRVDENVNDASAYFERGQAFAALRQFSEAVQDFNKALTLQPGDVPMLFWRAAQHGQLKNYDAAIADYADILKQQPKNYAALNNRGSMYRALKKFDLAIKDFTVAIALDNKQPTALINRSLAHRDRNELDAALVDLTAVIIANPAHAGALARRAETLELKANRDGAVADYRAVLKLPEPATGASEPHRTARARLVALGLTP